MQLWLRYSIGAQVGLLIGMGLGRFSYTPMVPVLIEVGYLSESEALGTTVIKTILAWV